MGAASQPASNAAGSPLGSPVTSAGASNDIFFSSVTSLLHMDGLNNSTTFTDQKGIVWTPTGNAKIDTGLPRFGSGSALFDRTALTVLTATPGAGFTFGVGDFTIEAWFNITNLAGVTNHFVCGWHTNWGIYQTGSQVMLFDGGSNIVASSTIISVATWYAVAVSRVSGTMYFFVEGVLIGTAVNATNFNLTNFVIGDSPAASGGMDGHIDEVRITKGVGRYTSAYVANGPFPNQ